MIIPVRCFTCNRVLASKYLKYTEIINSETNKDENILSGDGKSIDTSKETIQQKAFVKIGIEDRYCCKRHVISHIDLIEKI
jgi:DNA-directed RNA polymerase subunit N